MSQKYQKFPTVREIHIEQHIGGDLTSRIGIDGTLLGRVPTLIEALQVALVRAEKNGVACIVIHDDNERMSVHPPHTRVNVAAAISAEQRPRAAGRHGGQHRWRYGLERACRE